MNMTISGGFNGTHGNGLGTTKGIIEMLNRSDHNLGNSQKLCFEGNNRLLEKGEFTEADKQLKTERGGPPQDLY